MINATSNTEGKKYLVRCSFIEIYKEEIKDLLTKEEQGKLAIKEDGDSGVYIKGAKMFVAKKIGDIENALKIGHANRSQGETQMNQRSSRSHCIFTIYFETQEDIKGSDPRVTVGKLNLVDLAGSERQKKSGATGVRLSEATKINLSLTALMNVISALVENKRKHVPYRDSKLTRLL